MITSKHLDEALARICSVAKKEFEKLSEIQQQQTIVVEIDGKEISKAIEPVLYPDIHCAVCDTRAKRVGAQDSCDVYACVYEHVTRVPVGGRRKIWGATT